MSLSMAPLLIHSEHVPQPARQALHEAITGPPEEREAKLESAARVLYRETRGTELDCEDVRELVGLGDKGGGCGCPNG
jgi:hypothetical protein